MNKKVIYFNIFLCLSVIILLIICLFHYDGVYTGKIVDAETGDPIEGAAVLGIRQLIVYGGIEISLKYFDASETITDKEGRMNSSSKCTT